MDYPFICNILPTGQNTSKLLSHQVVKLWVTVSSLSVLTYEIVYLWEMSHYPSINFSDYWVPLFLQFCK